MILLFVAQRLATFFVNKLQRSGSFSLVIGAHLKVFGGSACDFGIIRSTFQPALVATPFAIGATIFYDFSKGAGHLAPLFELLIDLHPLFMDYWS